MFIAHAPAGYLVTKLALRGTLKKNNKEYKVLMALGIIASVLPDMDMIYFYLIDNRQHLHHSYWTHLPIFWFVIFSVLMLYGKVKKSTRFIDYVKIAGLSVFVHLILDSTAGKIRWFAPFSSYGVAFVKIPCRYNWWVLNYLINWSFGIELLIVGLALYVMVYRKQ